MLMLMLMLGISDAVLGQRADTWYFGEQAGLKFHGDSLEILYDGQLNHLEGSAVANSDCGAFLFYTDGVRVWDAMHSIMPNGGGLRGDNSSTQSACIIARPDFPSLFYVITAPAYGSGNYHWSVVDLSLRDGLGDVSSKNNLLWSNGSEKIALAEHANGRDTWVILHRATGTEFAAFLINPSGISAPVISNTGSYFSSSQSIGAMRASPNSKHLALALNQPSELLWCDFNNSSGVVSNARSLGGAGQSVYGVEFSPSNQYLYYSDQVFEKIWQIDLEAGSGLPDVLASKTEVGSTSGLPDFGQLALGPDGKIYVALNQGRFSRILSPDSAGSLSDYEHAGIYFGTGEGRLGLPFFHAQQLEGIRLTECASCPGRESHFELSTLREVDSVFWDFGDPASGVLNFASGSSGSHLYELPGNYTASAQWWMNGLPDSDDVQIEVIEPVVLDLGPDTVLSGGVLELNAGVGIPASYNWAGGSMDSILFINQPGIYWVEVELENGCILRDSIEIDFLSAFTDSEFELKLYPNPSDGSVYLSWPIPESIRLDLLNMQGGLLRTYELQGELNEQRLIIGADLEAGSYILQVHSESLGSHSTMLLLRP